MTTGEVDLKVRNAPLPSGLTLALFPLIPLLILKSISGASISSFSDLSFSFMGNVNIQIAAFVHDIEHEKSNKVPEKNRHLMQNLVFNAGFRRPSMAIGEPSLYSVDEKVDKFRLQVLG